LLQKHFLIFSQFLAIVQTLVLVFLDPVAGQAWTLNHDNTSLRYSNRNRFLYFIGKKYVKLFSVLLVETFRQNHVAPGSEIGVMGLLAKSRGRVLGSREDAEFLRIVCAFADARGDGASLDCWRLPALKLTERKKISSFRQMICWQGERVPEPGGFWPATPRKRCSSLGTGAGKPILTGTVLALGWLNVRPGIEH
jgi:hypothetical protein